MDYTCKEDKLVNYATAKDILNGECECSPEEYDEAVKVATKCIDLIVEVAKQVNDPSNMSSLMKEKIRRMINKELKHTNDNYVSPYEW